jgi:cobalt/nickel transport system permease protein
MFASPLAMHMANELLSVPVAGATLLIAGAVAGLAGLRAGRALNAERLPLMGVIGAFVFAAQMVNFTLPGMPGTSGHLGGGVLLAILLGPSAGIVTMTAILIVQCLLFQDGGLLALGCNVLNMGVAPALVGWALYRAILGRSENASPWRQYVAAWGASTVGVAAGAAMVPFQAYLSGVLRIPLTDFLAMMVGVHLLIGLVEGAITFAVLAYLRRTRPGVLGLPAAQNHRPVGRKAVLASILGTAMLLAGVVSWFASTHPDGLEWSYREHAYGQAAPAVANDSESVRRIDDWQARYTLLPEYSSRTAPLGEAAPSGEPTPETARAQQGQPEAESYPKVSPWGSLAGLVGTAVSLGLIYGLSFLLRRRRAPAGS